MKTIADTINEFIVPRYGEGLVLGFKDPVPEDRASKIEQVVKLRDANIITPNEAREELSYEESPEEGADQLQRPMPTFNPAEPNEEALPKSVANISYKKHLRKQGMYKRIETYKRIRKETPNIAKKLMTKKVKTQSEIKREHPQFTNEQVWDFHKKQIRLVDAHEDIFRNKVQKFIMRIVEEALDGVPEEVANMKSKALVDEKEVLVRAGIDFRPILTEVGILSAQEALKLVGDDNVYVPTSLRPKVAKNVTKFAKSMIETDRDKIIDTIAKGVADGKSIPVIKNQLMDEFAEYSKSQAERIARTEVLRASNEGAVDAWLESDVVTGKQWLTAEDDRVDGDCEEMNGVIVDLEHSYNGSIRDKFDDDVAEKLLDYGSVEEPPLHPNCRCTLLPVLVDQKAFDADKYLLENQVKALNEKLDLMDKRTREAKELLEQRDKYIAELEDFIDE